MRAVVQRVSRAAVRVEGVAVGEIGPGLVVFVGVSTHDEGRDAEYIASKVGALRVFDDDAGRMNRSVVDVGGSVLVVSQFTLQADCRRGRRPSFDEAAPADMARHLYEEVVRRLAGAGVRVATGAFGEHMAVELVNDGPVTLLIDSARVF